MSFHCTARTGERSKLKNTFPVRWGCGYCETSTRKCLHLGDIELNCYIHLYELLCGWVRDLYPALHQENNANYFFGIFLNQNTIADQTVIAHQDVLQANISHRFSVNTAALQSFLVTSYDDEVHESSAKDLNVQAQNTDQIHYIWQVLLRSEIFDHYKTVRNHMYALIGPARPGKTQTIISLISGTYCIIDDIKALGINLEALRRQLMGDNTLRVFQYDSSGSFTEDSVGGPNQLRVGYLGRTVTTSCNCVRWDYEPLCDG